ncbi:lebercilin-like protein [Thalassophryne amazonica]|uniref:lebercilin-like protein n=1 Tax=Thalassophryne amazonica TaxID=390379 RepID=UPI0014726182|nr:lebercilin-like protein [Thalassophryne amazonica]
MLRIQCAELTSVKELKNQVRDLQKQLSDTGTENKLLVKVQQRHMAALQYFQYSEGSHVQIVAKQENKAQGLKEIIRGVHACHVKLTKQLQTSENMLLKTKDSVHHLDQLNQDHTLLETEELIRKLDKATAELDSKNKRILELENNLELCQASFNHQNEREKRKAKEEQKKSCNLKETIQDLTQKIEDAEKELAKLNIYYHRLQNECNKKGIQRKLKSIVNENTITEVLENDSSDDNSHQNNTQTPSDNTEQSEEDPEEQTDEVCIEKEYMYVEEELEGQTEEQQCQEPLVVEYPEADVPEKMSTEDNNDTFCLHYYIIIMNFFSDISEKNDGCEENPEDQPEGSCNEENVEETHHMCHIGHRFPRIYRKYIFKQTIENLHNGRPAYCSENWTPCTRDVMVETSVKKPKAQKVQTEG